MVERTSEIERVYTEEIEPWLPERIWDCHAHITLKEHCGPVSPERRAKFWAMELAQQQTWSDLAANQRELFPDREVFTLAFGNVYCEVDVESNNDYVLEGALEPANRAAALVVTRPEWSAQRVESELDRGFVGLKPYPDLAGFDSQEMSIFDFLPREHLAAADQRGAVIMLHLPRADRIADPHNVEELRIIAEEYPRIKLIVAHVGRAYCLPTAQRGLGLLAAHTGILFDIAANLNADVLRYALDQVGPDRLLYGSDLPVAMMRGTREHIGETYVNYTDGPYSWNTNRKNPEIEARYVYFAYEEIKALIKAVESAGMGREAMEKVLFSNFASILGAVRSRRVER